MRKLAVFVATLLVTSSPAAAQAEGVHCKRILADPAFAQNWKCAETSAGAILGKSDDISLLLPAIDAAAVLFERHFEPPAAPIAIVRSTTVPASDIAALRSLGFVMLPWIDPGSMRSQVEASVRKQIDEKLGHLSPEKREEAVAKALAQLPGGGAKGQAPSQKELGALSHEIGHMWLSQMFDRFAQTSKPQYGSSALDWLDETAAVLAENEELTTLRREQLTDPGKLVPLAKWLSMQHPLFDAAAAAGRQTDAGRSGGATVRIVSGSDAKALLAQGKMADSNLFYLQSRAFADFMIQASGDQRIFAKVAAALKSGQSFEQWLKRDGKRAKLPNSMKALDRQWQTWLKARPRRAA